MTFLADFLSRASQGKYPACGTQVVVQIRDHAQFAVVQVNQELDAVSWPCGADPDPNVLYALVTGAPIPSLETTNWIE